MIYVQSMLALDIARERSAEAVARSRRHRQLAEGSAVIATSRQRATAALARIAAQVSRGSASLARRLDPPTASKALPDAGPCLP